MASLSRHTSNSTSKVCNLLFLTLKPPSGGFFIAGHYDILSGCPEHIRVYP